MTFEAFPKIPRLNRDITITEKIDGTNVAVVIEPAASSDVAHAVAMPNGRNESGDLIQG